MPKVSGISVRGVNYFCLLATTISAGEGWANEHAGDRRGLGLLSRAGRWPCVRSVWPFS